MAHPQFLVENLKEVICSELGLFRLSLPWLVCTMHHIPETSSHQDI